MPVSGWPEEYWLLTVKGYDELPPDWWVKVAVALDPAVACTVLAPGVELGGTAKEAVKAPFPLVVTEEGVVATELPA
jgi:hypothetical protein